MSREDKKYSKIRAFSRVDAHLPLELRVVSAEERGTIKARTSGDMPLVDPRSLPELRDKVLGEWINMLNSKLDAIINKLSSEREGFGALPLAHVNISGGGLGFFSKDKYDAGDIIEAKLLLPMMPPVALFVYCEVVKVDHTAKGYMTSTKFVAMNEEITDEIVKFVFKRQREILREQRR
ncbi:MAG TPA: PilZ domain-containing protein [Dissulfurispiraceae bacterium]|nr:PilZ domain-containing protein [Dissulfurispiraceae bacterium]